MTGWAETTIEQIAAPTNHALATGPFGSAISSKYFRDEGTPVIRGSNMSLDVGTRLIDSGLVFVDDELTRRFERSVVRKGDLVFTCWGTVGQIALIDDRAEFDAYIVSNKQMKLSPDPRRVDSLYLYYLLSSPSMVGRVTGQAIGAAVPGFNLGQLREIQIRIPGLSTQRRIASVLGAIDDLIENNRRRVEVLEEMARTIYRDWFVHFRYPGHDDVPLVDSDLGPIPSGWQAAELFDVADVTFGFPYKSKRFSDAGPFPVIRIRDVRDGATATFTDEQADKKYKVLDGDVLIGMDGDFHMAQWTGGRAWLNQRVTRLRPMGGMSARHLLLAVERPIQAWNRAISGTTVAHLGKKHLVRVRIAVPPPPLLEKATDVFASIEGEILRLTQSADRLAELRDLLLPRLVTGRIDVSELDLDALVDDVLRGTGTGTGVGNDPTAKPGTTGSASADAREPVTAEVG